MVDSVIDLETKQVAARFVTGRGGIKFLKELGAASVNALGQMQYAISGIPGSYVTIPNAVQSLAFAPSGKFVYVFNDQTRDITVVETKGHTSVRKTPTGAGSWGGSLFISPDNRHLVSSGLSKLLVFDLETGEAVTDHEFKGAIPHYVPSLGLVFLRSAMGAEIYRPAPMEKVKDLGPEAALPNEKQLPAAPGRLSFVNPTVIEPQTRRFFLFTSKGTSVYDYDLKLLRQIEGLFGVERVLLAPAPD